MKTSIFLVLALSSTVLFSCSGGGGGGGATPTPTAPKLAGSGGSVAGGGGNITINGVTFTHDQAVQMFLLALNAQSSSQTTLVDQGYYVDQGSYVDQGYYVDQGSYVDQGYYDDNGNWVSNVVWVSNQVWVPNMVWVSSQVWVSNWVSVSSPGPTYAVAKSETLQSGYAVVYDGSQYEAISVDSWNGSTSDPIGWASSSGSTFTNLQNLGNGTFKDTASGIIFEASKPLTKDIEKMAAFNEVYRMKGAAKNLQNFGFSEDRALEVTKLASQMEKSPKGSMTDKDYDNFSKQITGSSITQIKAALQKQVNGDASSLKDIINNAATTNGVGAEQMKQMLGTVIPGFSN